MRSAFYQLAISFSKSSMVVYSPEEILSSASLTILTYSALSFCGFVMVGRRKPQNNQFKTNLPNTKPTLNLLLIPHYLKTAVGGSAFYSTANLTLFLLLLVFNFTPFTMNDLTKKVVSHFYEESLKHKVYSEEFLNNSKKVSKMYMETFGMTQVWLDYHKSMDDKNSDTLQLLRIMYSELLTL